MKPISILMLALLAIGCGSARHPADVITNFPHNLARPCPTATPLERFDKDIRMRFIGTPGNRLFGCGTLYVTTVEVHVPAGWDVRRWERTGGTWAYAFLLSAKGKSFRRTYELATFARRMGAEIKPSVEFKVYRPAAADPPRRCDCPFVKQKHRPLLPQR